MNTYNFIYTLDDFEHQIEINANSEEEAREILKNNIPYNAYFICLI